VQLGNVMDSFANLTSLLSDERKAIESTVHNLGSVSTDAFDLLSLNRAGLDKDLTQLTRVLQAVKVNIGSVQQLLDSGPLLVNGLTNAYAPQFHRIDLRTQVSPTLAQVLGNTGLVPYGPCLPIDVSCTPVAPGSASAAAAKPAPAPAPAAAPAPAPAAPAGPLPVPVPPVTTPAPATTSTTSAPPNPIDSILRLFDGGGAKVGVVNAEPATKAAHAASGIGGFIKGVARALTGVLG